MYKSKLDSYSWLESPRRPYKVLSPCGAVTINRRESLWKESKWNLSPSCPIPADHRNHGKGTPPPPTSPRRARTEMESSSTKGMCLIHLMWWFSLRLDDPINLTVSILRCISIIFRPFGGPVRSPWPHMPWDGPAKIHELSLCDFHFMCRSLKRHG